MSTSEVPEDLRNYIPGVGHIEPPKPEVPAWKKDPRLYQDCTWPDGKVERLYTIGALALALGKKPVTLRKWIRKGVIPEAGLRTKGLEGTLGDAGRRLFTEEQIEAMIRISKDCGVWGEGRRVPDLGPFSARVWNLWRAKDW